MVHFVFDYDNHKVRYYQGLIYRMGKCLTSEIASIIICNKNFCLVLILFDNKDTCITLFFVKDIMEIINKSCNLISVFSRNFYNFFLCKCTRCFTIISTDNIIIMLVHFIDGTSQGGEMWIPAILISKESHV